MAELLIRSSSVGFIKAIIFDKDGTLSNSEEYLIELAKRRIQFAVNKFRKSKINNLKIILLKKLECINQEINFVLIYGNQRSFKLTKD